MLPEYHFSLKIMDNVADALVDLIALWLLLVTTDTLANSSTYGFERYV